VSDVVSRVVARVVVALRAVEDGGVGSVGAVLRVDHSISGEVIASVTAQHASSCQNGSCFMACRSGSQGFL
jgi:hypothetical protein